MKVRAIAKGYYGDEIRNPGDEFTISDKKHLGRWMEVVGGEKAADHTDASANTAPADAPAAKPLEKMNKAELIAYAFNQHQLELSPDNMTNKDIITAIKDAEANSAAAAGGDVL